MGINNATYNVGVGELNFNIGRDYAVHLLGSRTMGRLWSKSKWYSNKRTKESYK